MQHLQFVPSPEEIGFIKSIPSITFCKMHGLGNDYIYINCCNLLHSSEANDFRIYLNHQHNLIEYCIQKLCHRTFGIGADGVIFITNPTPELLENETNHHQIIHCQMEMYNSDGSSGEMCGNGLRCVAQFACDRLVESGKIKKQTLEGGQLGYRINVQSNRGKRLYQCICYEDRSTFSKSSPLMVEIEMGNLQTKSVNFSFENNSNSIEYVEQEENSIRKIIFKQYLDCEIPLYCLLVPNPHAICWVNEISSQNEIDNTMKAVDSFPLHTIGPIIENLKQLFPNRTNVEFIETISAQHIETNDSPLIKSLKSNCILSARQRTWERGSGETNACGTGAFAVSQVLYLRNAITNSIGNIPNTATVRISLNGGDLWFRYHKSNPTSLDHIQVNMIGSVNYSHTGSFKLSDYQ
ncbi:predicted protein [Naegleria gruberi]|uniref:diaminopimelate epimerase n=1 Tax=Naegleria gruberi TaxID=5762 RepID=D2VFY6_NAEGR|nr:uncharacterized protein NAEGRDRAFT_67790 [Naegleria gruberi]EFC44163.1 predicted protein [Naegleria gruberi]|eukprot:XP_002676907.1 predicted protein [Naegleria gruberi strain NEG-M]